MKVNYSINFDTSRHIHCSQINMICKVNWTVKDHMIIIKLRTVFSFTGSITEFKEHNSKKMPVLLQYRPPQNQNNAHEKDKKFAIIFTVSYLA